jgi:protein-histidine pros-kinase
MDGYLSKPMKAEDLQAVLERLLPDVAETEGPSDTPPVDLGAVDRTVGEDRALLAELVCVFQEDGPRRLAELRLAVENGDAGRLERCAHAVKGALSIFGAAAAERLARELETLGREGRLETAAAVFARLEAELARVLAFLADLPGVAAGTPPPPTPEALAAPPPPG